ncbi:MAG TPA: hypothetical protein VL326_37790, partial [Kofleriaceae bacterium]|nr:hypothetical protein [Kofleriaceae bacterium]
MKGTPPTWHTVLDYAGLFLFYFTGTLAAVLIGTHVARRFDQAKPLVLVAQIGLALASVLAAVPLVMHAPAALSIPLESLFALAIILLLASAIGGDRDMGAQLGLVAIALPLLLHTVSVYGARYVWPEGAFDGPVVSVVRAGVMALSIAALVSPYVFAPRPFARAVTKPGPVVFAMAIAAVGAVVARSFYPKVVKAASLAIGVELTNTRADPRLALYLLAIATLAWTLASCAFAPSAARRQIGSGLALVVLGGYGFHWPNHYLLPLFGFALVADAISRVREEELSSMPI